jgi:hypothetical protein
MIGRADIHHIDIFSAYHRLRLFPTPAGGEVFRGLPLSSAKDPSSELVRNVKEGTDLIHQAHDIGVNMQAPVRHHHIGDALGKGGNSLGSERLPDPLGFRGTIEGKNQKAPGIALGIDDTPQVDLKEGFEAPANAVLALSHNLGQFAELDAKNGAAYLVQPAASAPETEIEIVKNGTARVVARVAVIVRGYRPPIQTQITGHPAAAFAAALE